MERCVCKHIHNYLLENNIITNNQSGFTKGDSAIKMRVTLTHFQLVGNIPVLKDKLKSLQRGDYKIWVVSFNNLGLTTSLSFSK
jgi:hypothetical protein